MSSIATHSAALGAALFAAARASTQASLPPRELPFDEPRLLDELMEGDVSDAERVIFYAPRAMSAAGLELAAQLFRFWLFGNAATPYGFAPSAHGAGRPAANEPQSVRIGDEDRDVFLLPYERLRQESRLLREAEVRLRSRVNGELERRARLRGRTEGSGDFEQNARKQWQRIFDALAGKPPGETHQFGLFDQFDSPELAVTFVAITADQTTDSARQRVTNRDATLGAHALSAYVSGVATRRAKGIELTFSDLGLRVTDRFEFSGSQLLGVWDLERGLTLDPRGPNAALLTNAGFRAFVSGFMPRYNSRIKPLAKAGIAASPLVCRNLFVTSPMHRDGRPPHDPIFVPDPKS